MTSYELLTVDTIEDGGVLDIEMRSGKGNILTAAVMAELQDALSDHRDDKALRMVLLTTPGKNFSYGASVEEHTKDQIGEMLPTFHDLVREVANYPVPVAALVQGKCLGGAFELVLACHLVFATPHARFGCPEIKLGVFPPVLAAIGGDRLGSALSERMLLTGVELDADDADSTGWLVDVLRSDQPKATLLGWYREHLAGLSASSLRIATRAARTCSCLASHLGTALDRAEKIYLEELVETHDGNEGIQAFLDKRKPEWKHA